MKLSLPKNSYATHHTQKIHNFFKILTMWLKTFKYTCHDKLKKLVWNFAQMWKGNNWSFLNKNSLNSQKSENHVATFPYWFWFGSTFLNV
jgi:hypothetical protein